MSEENEVTEEEPKNFAAELAECQEKYLRLLAESENVRKRMQKERQELTQYAVENVLCELLHPLDQFESALKFAETMSDEVRNWAVGFEMILQQLKSVLSNHGVSAYEVMGKPFDPHWHEAVEMVETEEHEPGIVVEECLRGYQVGERPIRVARVKVSKEKEGEKEDE
ncbi:MAG: Protein GrpE [Chlamydiales bacterium]|nr:Protein GrpE [Chlamydiales bacterium]MCH9635543.1 Protein GrpE [Chlamydiales bacterium]